VLRGGLLALLVFFASASPALSSCTDSLAGFSQYCNNFAVPALFFRAAALRRVSPAIAFCRWHSASVRLVARRRFMSNSARYQALYTRQHIQSEFINRNSTGQARKRRCEVVSLIVKFGARPSVFHPFSCRPSSAIRTATSLGGIWIIQNVARGMLGSFLPTMFQLHGRSGGLGARRKRLWARCMARSWPLEPAPTLCRTLRICRPMRFPGIQAFSNARSLTPIGAGVLKKRHVFNDVARPGESGCTKPLPAADY